MGTHTPAYSSALGTDIVAVGGRFVEAPVSGSRGPAEAGKLVAILAGEPGSVEDARTLIAPFCSHMFDAGVVPGAMAMKLSVNLFLIASVAALAEAAHLAESLSLDARLLQKVIASSALSSEVTTAKLAKIVASDFAPQASIRDVCKNAALVTAAAGESPATIPMLTAARHLFDATRASGGGDCDMAAVIRAYRSGLVASVKA